jgi:hypothetical protein
VNAPYSEQLDAQTLAHCLIDHAAAKAKPGHMSSFFGEVDPALQVDFAESFNISHTARVNGTKRLRNIRANLIRSLLCERFAQSVEIPGQ